MSGIKGVAAPNQSDPNCANAVQVGVSAGGTVTGKDFALDDAVEISGHVYESDGATPIPGHQCTGRYRISLRHVESNGLGHYGRFRRLLD